MAEPEPEPEPEPLLELDYDHTVEGILVTVGVSSALYVIILIGVTVAWVRASHKPRDASKSDTPEETALEAWRRHFFGGSCASVLAWPVRLALLSDNTVETLVGRQPVAFLRFQRHLRVVLFVYTVLINGLILPVNLTGGNWEANPRNGTSEEDSGIGFWQQDRLMYITSASNVQTNDVPRLLAYLGVMVFVAGFSLANLGPRALVGRLLSRRQAQQAQFEPLLEHYSVMIRRFPRELDGEALQTTLEPLFPTEVVDVYVHSGSAFITFRTNRTARRFIASYTRLSKKWRWCRCRCTSSKDDVDKDRHATEATGVEWSADGGRKRRESALVLSELDVVDFPPDMVEMLAMRKWKLRWAPPAKDLVWAKLDVHWCGRAVRWWIMTACLMTFIILTVLTVTVTTKLLEFADLFFDKVLLFDTSSALYTQYLPVLLALTINAGIVPALIETQAETEGHYLVSNISQACLRKQCAFLCLAVVILPSLALESSRDLAFAIYEHLNPEEVIDLIGREVLNVSGPYFIRYILQAAIVGTSVNMLLIQPSFFKLLDWCCRGGRGEIVWQFPYEYHYAICCCIFCVSVASGMVFPPLMPVGLLYFVLKTLSDKFVLVRPPRHHACHHDCAVLGRSSRERSTHQPHHSHCDCDCGQCC